MLIGGYAWPAATRLEGSVVPKDRVLAHAGKRKGAPTALRRRFVDEVARITRRAFLSPDTLNLPAGPGVPHVNVLRLDLHGDAVHPTVLEALDRAVPGPTVLELHRAGRLRLAAAHKRPAESGPGWVCGPHTVGEPSPENPGRPLPAAVSLERLYAGILTEVWATPPFPGEPLADQAARVQARVAAARELAKAEAALARERQYHRKVELNARVRELRVRYERLAGDS